jgi:DNA-binding NtrC family response regulator
MAKKPVIIIVEDEEYWLNYLTTLLNENIKCQTESFSSFKDAENRLMQKPPNFDLLVTDVRPPGEEIKLKGLKFANFASEIIFKPVVVVTGTEEYANLASQQYNIAGSFWKGDFEPMDFIMAVRKGLKNSNKPPGKKNVTGKTETNPPNKKGDSDTNTKSSIKKNNPEDYVG